MSKTEHFYSAGAGLTFAFLIACCAAGSGSPGTQAAVGVAATLPIIIGSIRGRWAEKRSYIGNAHPVYTYWKEAEASVEEAFIHGTGTKEFKPVSFLAGAFVNATLILCLSSPVVDAATHQAVKNVSAGQTSSLVTP